MEKNEEDDTPLVGIFCLKTRQDMKRFEETEDCFILDFDPFDSFDVKKLTFTDDVREGDKDLSIIHETGQVWDLKFKVLKLGFISKIYVLMEFDMIQ